MDMKEQRWGMEIEMTGVCELQNVLDEFGPEILRQLYETGGMDHVYTYNDRLKRKLEELFQCAPDQVRLKTADDTGAVTYAIPKAPISIRRPHSEQSRAAARERALRQQLRPPVREKSPD